MLSLYVQDVEKAKAFYTEFLSMKLIPAFSSPSFVFLQPTEGTPIALQDVAALPPGVPAQPGGFELNLEVEDAYTMGHAPDGRQRLVDDQHLASAYSSTRTPGKGATQR